MQPDADAMPSLLRPPALFAAAALALSACGDAGTAPAVMAAEPACTPAASLQLAAGETAALTAEQARCFRVAAGGDAEYALAGYDPRALDASRDGRAVPALADPRYTIADATRGGASAALAPAAPAADGARPEGHLRFGMAADAGSGSPFARTTPWREGERFAVAPLEGTGTATARVVRVVGGRFVLAVMEGDAAAAENVLQQSAQALEFLAREGVPLLRSAFNAAIPATSAGSGQLLVLATAWDPSRGAAATWTHEDDAGAWSYVWLNTNLRGGMGEGYETYDHTSYRIKVLGHELTHAWQAGWMHATHGHAAPDAAGWALEGGADLVGMSLVRRYLNVARDANWRWTEHLEPRRESVVLALEPFGARGRLTWGYYDASSLLRDLQTRLIAAGMSPEAALAEVSRAAVEGWHGTDGDGGACEGLAERMRARLGAGWDPAGAVLLWTAAQAADDRTGNPALNNPSYYGVGGADEAHGWAPAADVRAGSGQRATVSQVAGGSFYVRLRGASSEGVFAATSDQPDARWMLVRLR